MYIYIYIYLYIYIYVELGPRSYFYKDLPLASKKLFKRNKKTLKSRQ